MHCMSKCKISISKYSNHEIQFLDFNSNFTCECQTRVSDLVDLALNLSSINSKDRSEYNTAETNDEYFEDLSIQPDFNYYQTHDFYKLAMKLE